jgi:hypothetical protein
MKNYKNLVESLPSKTVVFAFGRFNPPTVGHELLIKAVKKLAVMHKAEHAIYASRTYNAKKDPLTIDKKIHYLNLLFPNTKFVAANEEARSFMEAAKQLNKKYKNLIMVAGSDRVPEYKNILEKYNGKEFNFDSIQVISAGERDPDSDNASGMSATKMRAAASKGDFNTFKKGLPSHVRDIDAKLLMNDVRVGLKLDPLKEQVKFTVDALRENYFSGKLFNEGDLVESNGTQYTIIKRGSNHLLVEDSDGNKVSKWITDVNPIQISEAEMNEELTKKTIKSNDKIKVARMIADFLGYEDAEKSSSPSNLLNLALRKVKTKLRHAESINILVKMLKLATEVGIEYDKNALPAKLKEAVEPRVVPVNTKSKRNAGGDIMSYKDFKKSLDMNRGIKEEIDTDNLDDDELNVMDVDGKRYKIKKWDHRRVGYSLGNTDNDQLRRMKIRYKNEEVNYELDEDVYSADYKVNPDTGRKSRAHRITFANSGIKDKLDPEAEKKAKVQESITQATGTSAIIAREDEIQFTKAEKKTKKPDARIKNDSNKLGANNAKGFDPFFEEVDDEDEDIGEDFSEDELEKMVDEIESEDDVLDAYEDDEIAIVDDETGEEVESDLTEENEQLNEILSRQERIRARVRFARTKSKRQRKVKIALKKRSDSKTLNRRARKLAISTLKKRLARKPLNKLTVGEKERLERIVKSRKQLIDRLAMRMAPKVRKIEIDRLSHKKYTKD